MRSNLKNIISSCNKHLGPNKIYVFLFLVLVVILINGFQDNIEKKAITHTEDFKQNKVITSNSSDLLNFKDKMYKKQIQLIEEKLNEKVKMLTDKMNNLLLESQKRPEKTLSDKVISKKSSLSKSHPIYKTSLREKRITFPTKFEEKVEELIKIPKGSRFWGTLLNGAEVKSGGREPILIAIDYKMIMPNNYSLDLVGCLALGKSEGNESNERVDIEVYNIACISNYGEVLEMEHIKGWAMDANDNSNGVIGKINEKGNRSAYKAAFAEMLSGASQLLSMAGSAASITPLGGVNQVFSKTNTQSVVAGGVSKGAQSIAQWWTRHAKSMIPTINIQAGRTVWVGIMKTIEVPKKFFKKEIENYEDRHRSIL